MKLLLLLAFSLPVQAGWLSNFCEKHIVTDDPNEFESTSVDGLISLYFDFQATGFPSKTLINEMNSRITNTWKYSTTDEEKTILVAVLNNKGR